MNLPGPVPRPGGVGKNGGGMTRPTGLNGVLDWLPTGGGPPPGVEGENVSTISLFVPKYLRPLAPFENLLPDLGKPPMPGKPGVAGVEGAEV